MRALLILGSSLAWQMVSGSILVPVFATTWLPQLSVVWLTFLADEPAPTATREREVFLRNLAYALVLGYLDSRATLGSRGLFLGVYALAYLLVRVLSAPLGSAAAIFAATTIAAGGVYTGLWWMRGLLVRFENLPPFQPLTLLLQAALSGALAVIVFPLARQRLSGPESRRV